MVAVSTPRSSLAIVEMTSAQTHRRFLKTHLPLDGLPYSGQIFTETQYVLTEDTTNSDPPAPDAENYQAEADCNGPTCELKITTTGTETVTVALDKTDFEVDKIVFEGEDFTE